ncbi:MAG TPA: succinate dehydrogenase, hydrophobic membrane anchor protein [Rhizomicrobium sp.]|nr:succinate dehydrogenase, hydrophobic membrane anchor protein [Rhizomicrobium sp.]
MQTPLSRVQGLGASHTGTRSFWRQRITAVALVPLAIWFLVAVLGLVGGTEAEVAGFFQHPVNAILMFLFIMFALWHMMIGLQEVIEDYAHAPGAKLILLLLNRAFTIVVGASCLLALLKIAI